jgi:alkylated DNA repair dioxygenase AlkB
MAVEAGALAWQPSLLDLGSTPAIDPTLRGVVRHELADGAWVDHLRGWVRTPDVLFADLLDGVAFAAHSRWMYEKRVAEPRLRASGVSVEQLPPVVEEMRLALSRRYETEFLSIGCNLYRDGRDSVAWHGDRIARDLSEAIVAIVSLGGRRRFLLRPKGGGPSVRFDLRSGDLLVMGGSCQRTWDHSVPKAASAEPRISITFRHAYS